MFGLVSGGSISADFAGNFPTLFPVLCIDSLHEFLVTRKGVQIVMMDHVVFDMFGESIVSLSAECCVSPLNSCG